MFFRMRTISSVSGYTRVLVFQSTDLLLRSTFSVWAPAGDITPVTAFVTALSMYGLWGICRYLLFLSVIIRLHDVTFTHNTGFLEHIATVRFELPPVAFRKGQFQFVPL